MNPAGESKHQTKRNQHGSALSMHPVLLVYIYMCMFRYLAHIYSGCVNIYIYTYTLTVCIVTYIWAFYCSKLLSRGYRKVRKHQSSRLKKIQQQLGTYRQ